ncbi:PAS domain S-box family protein, partial [Ichthyophthirius multifiliis]
IESNQNINVNKFQNPQEVIDHIFFIHQLIENDKRKSKSGQLLNGYIEFHNKTCIITNCPLKKIKFVSFTWKKQKQKISQNEQQQNKKKDKRYQFCEELISKLFEINIQKFPKNIPLRIYYSVFLMKIIKNKQHALNQVVVAENLKCESDERFILYYIKRSIESEISEISKQDGEDYGEQRSLEDKINNFKSAMEQTVSLLMEFWSQFSDDKPDLIKLYDIGSKLFPLKILVDDMWKKINTSKNILIPKVFRIYSKYLIDIFNDKQQGIQLLEKAQKIEQNLINKKDYYFNIQSDFNIDNQEDGIIFITIEEEKLGQIIACNLNAGCLFGYQKEEIINKNVNLLQPFLYGKYHDDILKYFCDQENKQSVLKDKFIFGKNKQQYIFPIMLNIKPVLHVLKDSYEFFGIFRKEKIIKNICYLHVNEKDIVKDISSSCINILGLDINILSLEQINVNNLFIDIQQNKQQYMSKKGFLTDYIFPQINEDVIMHRKGDKQVKVNVQIMDLKFKCKENQLIGQIYKIENIQEKTSSCKSQRSNLLVNQNYCFQFKLCILENNDIIYNGLYLCGSQYVEISNFYNEQSFLFEQNIDNIVLLKNSNINSLQNKQDLLQDNINNQNYNCYKIDYSKGIRTIKLVNNQLHDAEKYQYIDSEEEEEEEEMEDDGMSDNEVNRKIRQKKITLQKSKENSIQNELFDQSGIKSAQGLNEELDKQLESKIIQQLKIFTLLALIVIITNASIDFAQKNIGIKKKQNLIQEINLQSTRISEIQEIICYVRELKLLSEGIRIPQYSENVTNNDQKIKNDQKKLEEKLKNSINEVEKLNDEIDKITSLENYVVNVFYYEKQSTQFNINYVYEQIITRSHNLVQNNLLNDEKIDQFFIQFNGLNDFTYVLLKMYNQLNQKMLDCIEEVKQNALNVLIASFILMFIFALFLLFFLGKSIFVKQLVLSVFLDIPEKTSKFLYLKCETFLAQLGQVEDDDFHSDVDYVQEKEENIDSKTNSIFGKRRKKFKNTDRGSFIFLFRIIIIVIFIELYFISNYFFGIFQLDGFLQILKEYNFTCFSEPYYSLVLNGQKQMIYNNQWTILNQNSLDILTQFQQQIYLIDETIHEQHAKNLNKHDNQINYLQTFQDIMFGDTCKILVQQKGASLIECNQFAKSVVKQGMITVLIRYFQLIRYFNDRYISIINNPLQQFDFKQFEDEQFKFIEIDQNNNIMKNNLLNLLRIGESYELIQIQTQYLKYSISYLKQIFTQEILYQISSYEVIGIILLTFFIILLFLSTILCWNPFLSQINKEIWSTKCLLSFIPIDEMTKIKSISDFIRKYIINRKI